MLGENIKAIREALGMTRQQFADVFHVSADALNNIERDRLKTPNLLLVDAIAYKYDVDRDWILYGDGVPRFKNTTKDKMVEVLEDVNPIIRSFVLTYRDLDPEHRKIVDNYLNKAVQEFQNSGRVHVPGGDELLARTRPIIPAMPEEKAE